MPDKFYMISEQTDLLSTDCDPYNCGSNGYLPTPEYSSWSTMLSIFTTYILTLITYRLLSLLKQQIVAWSYSSCHRTPVL